VKKTNEVLNKVKHTIIPIFGGNVASNIMWWTKLRSFSKLGGFSEVINEEPIPNLPSEWGDINDFDS
jgi:hypothetical protein